MKSDTNASKFRSESEIKIEKLKTLQPKKTGDINGKNKNIGT